MRHRGRTRQPGHMEFDVDPLVAVIVTGEIGFWVVLGAGLVARYLLRPGPPPWRPSRSGGMRS